MSWSVGSLALGWSVLEGLGAALVLPALVALIAALFAIEHRLAHIVVDIPRIGPPLLRRSRDD